MTDKINPSHYKRNDLECIEAITAAVQNLKGIDAYCTGAAIKYLWRWAEKNGEEDLEKAMWFIKRMMDMKHGTDSRWI